MFQDTLNAWSANVAWLALAFALTLLALWFERTYRERFPRLAAVLSGASITCALVIGLFKAWKVLWLCDDAYITLHYSANFARGHGLVFNLGEWVEGYTNFLWALGLGLLAKVGFDLPRTALFGNLACFALALVLLTAFVRKVCRELSLPAPVIVYAMWAMALSSAFTTFGSSGLETMPAAFWVLLGLYASTFSRGPLLSGLAFTAAALTRPDHILYGVAMGVGFVVEGFFHHRDLPFFRRIPWKRALTFAAPFILIFIPYWFWRWHAYGDFYPNTYYAKSGGETYLAQGFVYLAHFLLTTGAWLGAPALLLAVLGWPSNGLEARLRVFALASVALMGTYVVRVGGDFMEHRFFITLLPLMAALTEVSLRSRAHLRGRLGHGLWRGAVTMAAVAAFAFAVVPTKIIGPLEKKWNLAAEETFYPVKQVYPQVELQGGLYGVGKSLEKTFPVEGVQPVFATGCVGMVGYYSRLPIIDTYGLVNRRVAHKPIAARGRPGHEKHADFDDVWEQQTVLADVPLWGDWKDETAASVPGLPMWFVRYDGKVASAMVKGGGSAPNVEGDIQRFAASNDRAQVLKAFGFYRRFLEKDSEGPRRLARLEARLAAIADFEGHVPKTVSLSGSFHLEKGAAPVGASGEGWLSSQGGAGTFQWEDAAQSGQVLRVSLGGLAQKGSVKVSAQTAEGWQVVAEEALEPQTGLVTHEWAMPAGATRAKLEVSDDDAGPGREVLIDALRFQPVGEAARLAFLEGKGDGAALGELRKLEHELPPATLARATWYSSLAQRFSFEEEQFPKEMTVEGNAFGKPVSGPLPQQSAVTGIHGARFANSYHGTDVTTGRLSWQLPDTSHVFVNLLVGGGGDCNTVYVALKVGAKEAARTCGRGDEVLRPAVLEAKNPKGEPLLLEVVDKSTTGWGHILVDDVMVLVTPPEISAR
ncbi:MAG: hypothetical protein K1X64_07540 [Myxococcaceae bacterium]|nr:hypothetical protein [Myxococcaceae bacterium]